MIKNNIENNLTEFRVYYDDDGKILFYTCEKLAGKYLIIDSSTFAQARPDLRVIDGKLSSINPKGIISKLKPSQDKTGQPCAKEDISIIVDDTDVYEKIYWKLDIHEF